MNSFQVIFGEFLFTESNFDTALEHLKRSISAICREGRNVTYFYLGKGSGSNGTEAAYRRFDDKKTNWELTEVWALYESRSKYLIKESLNNLPPLAQPANWAERSGETG